MTIVLRFKYREQPKWRLAYVASEDGVVRWLLWEMMGRKLKMSQSVRFWGVWHPAELVWHPPKFDTLPNGTPLPNVVSRHPSLETKFTQASSSTSPPMSTLISLHDRISRSIIRGGRACDIYECHLQRELYNSAEICVHACDVLYRSTVRRSHDKKHHRIMEWKASSRKLLLFKKRNKDFEGLDSLY